MTGQLLICTDLDRTLIPNGPQSESPNVRQYFAALCSRPEVTLAYVSGRHRALIEKAISNYRLPRPDYVIGDVGTTIYVVGSDNRWTRQQTWETEIARDWAGKSHADIKSMLSTLPALRAQETAKQNAFKLSYYVPLQADHQALSRLIERRLQEDGIASRLIWSIDEPAGIGLLDVLPARASKYHAIEALMQSNGHSYADTVFCGDSGNDIEVLASPIPAVLVANSQPQVRELANKLARDSGHADRLYVARGNFNGMNGNYAGGMLEGIAHYHPDTVDWMGLVAESPL